MTLSFCVYFNPSGHPWKQYSICDILMAARREIIDPYFLWLLATLLAPFQSKKLQ
jgi:hypothetical protein